MSERESHVIATCPAGHDNAEFTYLGQMGDEIETIDLWNCDQGHTVSADSIAAATVAAYDGA